MSDTADRTATAADDRAPVLPRWPDRFIDVSTYLAWLCLALVLGGLVFGLVPVRNPRVQDCGTPLAFVLTGRVDGFVDPNHPPKGMTAKQAEAANARPCRKRVAPRAVHSGELLFGALLAGLTGTALLLIGRSARRRALLREWPAPQPVSRT